jgi:hypothetical protein
VKKEDDPFPGNEFSLRVKNGKSQSKLGTKSHRFSTLFFIVKVLVGILSIYNSILFEQDTVLRIPFSNHRSRPYL